MAPPDDPPPDDDPKVKDLIDDATRADLERWFGLPSFQQLAEQGKQAAVPEEEDPAIAADRERREQAMAAVDRAMVERLFQRHDVEPEAVLKFRAQIDVLVDPSMSRVDHAMIERRHLIAEPREVDIPLELRNDLAECTPQALLRDLHRPETDFQKQFERVDVTEERLDPVATISKMMATRWATGSFERFAGAEGRAILSELHRDRRAPIANVLSQLWNRRVQD